MTDQERISEIAPTADKCPECGSMDVVLFQGEVIKCTPCGYSFMTPTTLFEKVAKQALGGAEK